MAGGRRLAGQCLTPNDGLNIYITFRSSNSREEMSYGTYLIDIIPTDCQKTMLEPEQVAITVKGKRCKALWGEIFPQSEADHQICLHPIKRGAANQ